MGRLGEGGNAIVYRALPAENGAEEIALKVLKTVRVDSENFRRFVREVSVVKDELAEVAWVLVPLSVLFGGNRGSVRPIWSATCIRSGEVARESLTFEDRPTPPPTAGGRECLPHPDDSRHFVDGRGWFRTSDLSRVKRRVRRVVGWARIRIAKRNTPLC
jgi:hypothetical protein